MQTEENLLKAQKWLLEHHIDGWLLYSFQRSNDICLDFLDLPRDLHQTRGFFYFIPQQGTPIILVHEIEKLLYKELIGEFFYYSNRIDLDRHLKEILSSCDAICMEYSPENAIPSISKIDAGLLEKIQSYNIDVISSGPLLQSIFAQLTNEQLESHEWACIQLEEIVNELKNYMQSHKNLYEVDLQNFIIKEFARRELLSEGKPICAVGVHSADPHYQIFGSGKKIEDNQVLMIDLWAKSKSPNAIFADTTKMFFTGNEVPPEVQNVFDIVQTAQEKAICFINNRVKDQAIIKGFEVDEVVRDYIEQEGFGPYFLHRLGHNIEKNLHGRGAHLDSYETLDDRPLVKQSVFSIEPGLYIPGQFGIRLELNAYITDDHQLKITTNLQNKLFLL